MRTVKVRLEYMQEKTGSKCNAHTVLYSLMLKINANGSDELIDAADVDGQEGMDDAQLFSTLLAEFGDRMRLNHLVMKNLYSRYT